MQKYRWIILVCIGLFIVIIGFQSAWADKFSLTSPQLKDGGMMPVNQIFHGFGCTGKNISPELIWHNPPAGTKSFAVMVYDPDAPTGSGWWHWVIFNIPSEIRRLPADAGNVNLSLAPKKSIQSMTDFGKQGYGGACPPKGSGPHRYIFTVFALDIESLPLDTSVTAAMVGFHLNQHAMDKTQLTVIYSR